MKKESKVDRRAFLQLSIGAGILAYCGYRVIGIFWPFSINKKQERTITSYLDVLIPGDETPSSSQAGVPAAILLKANRDRRFRKLILDGCRWLDREAKKRGAANFPSLPTGEQVAVVAMAAEGESKSLPKIFFLKTRYVAFFHYYADPGNWKGIGYDGPPQPEGFPDYDLSPKAKLS